LCPEDTRRKAPTAKKFIVAAHKRWAKISYGR
jgi:hypothetical protein